MLGNPETSRSRMRISVALAVASAAVLTAPATASADTVTAWNVNATGALFATAGQPPTVGAIHLAMVHGAVYDAVNAIDKGYEPYLLSPRVATPFDSQDAAAATAAYRVLRTIVPAQEPVLAAQYAASLAGVPDGTAKNRGIAVGEAAAAAMLAARTDDGRFGPFRFTVGMGPGVWKPVLPAFVNDPNGWVKDVRPFLIEEAAQFRSRGPLALTSRKYAREFEEVKEDGALVSTSRSDDETHAVRYWAENGVATWSRIARAISAVRGLSLADNARLFSMLYLSAADAAICVWDDKEFWSFWRPITAIREADTDGNPATAMDGGWLPLIATPPYPDHPSGHAGISGSIVATLQNFFHTDRIAFSDTNVGGLTRSWDRLSEAIEEIVDARVWSGIHFRTADEQGHRIGRQVAKFRDHHYFQPARRDGEDD